MRETLQYSSRLGAITPVQFQAALDHFRLGTFLAAQPISGGLFGQNVFVTSTAGEWVLRGCPHYDWQFPKERYFARLIHEHTDVPVPWPYLVDPDPTIFGWEYVLMPRMSGLQTSDPALRANLSPEAQLQIASGLGKTLAELHAFHLPHYGDYELGEDRVVPHTRSWPTQVATEIADWLEQARVVSDRTTPNDVAWTRDVLARGRGALEVPFSSSILLHDYNYNNTVASHDGVTWRITGVFDLMEASVGDGERDLCRQTAMYLDQDRMLARTFVQSYLRECPPRPGLAERLAVYLLGERIIVWGYGQRHPELEWWDGRLTLREWTEPYLEEIANVL